MNEILVRTLIPADWESVRTIYLEGIATGQATFETEAPSWEEWDSNHLPAPRLIAASVENPVVQIAGWAALSPVSSRTVYSGVAEVSVYVGNNCRGQGFGRALLEALVVESEQNGIWTLQAGIFPENTASIKLHKSCGFREVGRRERVAKMKAVWRDTVLLERRSGVVGRD